MNNGASELHTSPTSSASSSAAFNTSSSTQPQANYGVPPPSTAGLGMYRDEYADDKDAVKGGIPSLFDITVPVPRELAQGLDFG